MEIIETSVFTRHVSETLDPESYRRLQIELADRPDKGRVIPGSGGLRKVRWEDSGGGKRGGTRVIYYWVTESDLILMLLIYRKADREDLSRAQVKALRGLVEEELK